MELYVLAEFLQTLKETKKLFFKNGKLMFLITLLVLLCNSLFYLFNTFCTKPFIRNILLDEQSLTIAARTHKTPFTNIVISLKRDLGFFFEFEWLFVLVTSLVSLLLATVTILASAITHGGKNLTFSTILLKAIRSWKRPLITWLYVTLMGIGYIFLILSILYPLSLTIPRPSATFTLTFTVVIFLASILYIHFTVVWFLSLVVSIIEEEKSGIQALGKAARIVKGKKIHGFLLNFIFTIPVFLVQGIWLMKPGKAMATRMIIGLVVINSICLVRVVFLVAYTLFYLQCKKIHGEEVKILQESVEYTELPMAPHLVQDDIP